MTQLRLRKSFVSSMSTVYCHSVSVYKYACIQQIQQITTFIKMNKDNRGKRIEQLREMIKEEVMSQRIIMEERNRKISQKEEKIKRMIRDQVEYQGRKLEENNRRINKKEEDLKQMLRKEVACKTKILEQINKRIAQKQLELKRIQDQREI